ncbi:hypothetical protein [Actinomyces weissii]|uniref:Uncharacterized protein n=1 Tax=Actinomyces weissii TaxID=675090 RepID=A0A7T7M9Z6_9ACTO|nr:hypothetical protein [Actinomyces weissii]QQM67653.1 hypothetical protein JG540_01845 [Actinomyces weissii]
MGWAQPDAGGGGGADGWMVHDVRKHLGSPWLGVLGRVYGRHGGSPPAKGAQAPG